MVALGREMIEIDLCVCASAKFANEKVKMSAKNVYCLVVWGWMKSINELYW